MVLNLHRLTVLLLWATLLFVVGIDWGLPTRWYDDILIDDDQAWSAQRIAELVPAGGLMDNSRGADVDANPLDDTNRLTDLTATDEQRAEILVRYRLYSFQPDEMVTFRALYRAAQHMDPGMYQYGGLFVYGVGAALRVAHQLRLVELRSDLEYYLKHPAEFARFYIVARMLVVCYGLVGVVLCTMLAHRLAGGSAASLAAVLFVLLPVIVTAAHEAKPHLPAAVWMLAAVLMADSYIRSGVWRRSLATGLMVGLATATVPSACPIWLVLPAMLVARADSWNQRVAKLAASTAVSVATFSVLNPLLIWNLLTNRDVVRSNLGTTAAMFPLADIGGGLTTVAALTLEAVGPAVVIAGLGGALWLCVRRRNRAMTLLIPPAVALAVMVAVGAGKPGEFARFGVFAYAMLAVLAAVGLARLAARHRRTGWLLMVVVVVITGWPGMRCFMGFCIDAYGYPSRVRASDWLDARLVGRPEDSVGVVREPAPYAVGPIDFAHRRVILLPDEPPDDIADLPDWLMVMADRRELLYGRWWLRYYDIQATFPTEPVSRLLQPTPISWANKPMFVFRKRADVRKHAVGKPVAQVNRPKEATPS